jgi:pyruvate dehydrogenase E2 component (dihydrolipoamide acetyltransferase)
MAKRVIMPKLGQTVEESTIVQWRKQEGDKICKGDILLEIETDKANMEVESFVEGTLLKVLRSAGETVPVMELIAFVGEPGEPLPEVESPGPTAKQKQPEAPRKVTRPAASRQETEPGPSVPLVPAVAKVAKDPTGTSEADHAVFRISPRAAKLAKDSVIDPKRIRGSGPDGRIIESDVIEYLQTRNYHQIRITPSAKRLAAQHGLDLLNIHPEAEAARITTSDIRTALSERPKPLPRIRQVVAERLTQSFTTTPHFYVTVSVDVSDLLELRSKRKSEGREFTLTDFILRSVALTLPEFPMMNSSTTDGKLVRCRSGIHLGLAVSAEKGLLVPVIRHADRLTLDVLHDQAVDLATRARAGELMPDEMAGSTFSISNMGMLDVENFTAIINPGESGILAVSSALKTPVVRDDNVVVRSMMKMTLSVDHRLVDGAMAARFINAVKKKLEDVEQWTRLI